MELREDRPAIPPFDRRALGVHRQIDCTGADRVQHHAGEQHSAGLARENDRERQGVQGQREKQGAARTQCLSRNKLIPMSRL